VKIRKAVILAAGYGTRFLPATKAVPKEMLPLVDKPVIQYIVEEAVAAGIEQIIMVTSAGKRSMEDHFDRQFELESALEKTHKADALASILKPAEVNMAFIRQKERLGNGHALLIARALIGNEPFAIFFPDDVIFHNVPAIRQLIDVHERFGHTVLAVQQVPPDQISQYGVIEHRPVEPRIYDVRGVVEKPRPQDAPSNLATVGRFVATPDLLDVLESTPVGRSGELWLMDAFDLLLKQQPVYAYEYEGLRFDCGQPLGLLQASIHVAMQNESIGPELRRYIQSLNANP